MSTVQFTPYATADAPTWTTLNGLASSSYAMSSIIDNTSSDASGGKFLYGDAELDLGSAVTAGTGNPSVLLFALWSPGGVNFPSPPGATAGAAGMHMLSCTALVTPSAAFQTIMFPTFGLRPAKLKLMIFNFTGVSFPASGVTCSLYRYGEQVA